MPKTHDTGDMLPQAERGSIRQGTTITAVGYGLRFEIPKAWVRWYEENEEHPNLHLTSAELDEVKETEGEWDKEFALIVNAILPFNQCVAHVGGDGWGPRGLSYSDLQVRVYVLTTTPEEIERRARSQGIAVAANLTGASPTLEQEQMGTWRRIAIKYFRMYLDYGATSIVDLRIQRIGNHTVAFVFIYTDHAQHEEEIEAMLNSVEFSGAA
jgi:DNA-binding beta-propeller fold protein YncE